VTTRTAAFDRFRRAPGARPLLWGHRGAPRGAPENTLEAFELALARGADGVELDVRLSGDGEVVVLHDPDLQRVAGVALSAARASAEALSRHDLGGGARVPRLDDALSLVLGRGALVNVELKSDVPDRDALVGAVVGRVAALPQPRRAEVLLSCFDAAMCRALRVAVPEVVVALLLSRVPVALPDLLMELPAVHPRGDRLDSVAVARLRSAGLLINAWTINRPAEARRLAELGVDGLITDDITALISSLS
jgi:glycerophosphoryl diester phosphodiesterase